MKRRVNCFERNLLSICNQTDLASDMEFMTVERVKNECDCVSKSVCITIVEALNRKDTNKAFVLLSDLTAGI
jgi:hypothetical protein